MFNSSCLFSDSSDPYSLYYLQVATPDATLYPPGEYTVASGYINVRKEPDTTSDIIAQPNRDEKVNLVRVVYVTCSGALVV